MTPARIIAPSIAPRLVRGVSDEDAAAYIGVGRTTFLDMVEDGRMPRPIKIGRRSVWDIRQLDRAFDALSGDTAAADEWEAFTAGGKRHG